MKNRKMPDKVPIICYILTVIWWAWDIDKIRHKFFWFFLNAGFFFYIGLFSVESNSLSKVQMRFDFIYLHNLLTSKLCWIFWIRYPRPLRRQIFFKFTKLQNHNLSAHIGYSCTTYKTDTIWLPVHSTYHLR